MGGEWSKLIGETGENRVRHLLEIIGWMPHIANYDIPCSLSEKHGNQEKKKHRREHGLDGSLMYHCPLIDGTQQHVVISVKYSDERYPTEGKLGKTFGEHYRSLTQMCVCYQKAPQYGELTASDSDAERFPVAGVLFWLNHCPEDDASSICPALVSTRPDADPNVSVFLVDNHQAAFLYDSIAFVRRNFQDSFAFNYQSTGKNLDARSRRHQGKLLPIQLVNAPQIVFRCEDEGRLLVVCSKNPFSESDFKRLCDLAQYLTQAWANKVIIAFRAYDKMREGHVVEKVKQMYSRNEGLKNVDVYSLEDNFRNDSAK
jgi:hypothetical protein